MNDEYDIDLRKYGKKLTLAMIADIWFKDIDTCHNVRDIIVTPWQPKHVFGFSAIDGRPWEMYRGCPIKSYTRRQKVA
jgi:hypothetical protein